ncbi:MAG: phage holin family protein [Cetobacterium somerae]
MPSRFFNEGLAERFNTLLESNIYLYICVAVLCYLIGGFDELVTTLLILNIISLIFACIKSWRESTLDYIGAHVLKMIYSLIMIVLGVMVDKTLKLDMAKILSLRNYLILYLSHREIVDIYLALIDEGVKIPTMFKKYVEILKKKRDKEVDK